MQRFTNNYMEMVMIPIICMFAYGLVQQIRETIVLAKSNKNKSKLLIWSTVCSLAYGVFLISFILNIVIAFMGLNNKLITSENTSIVCTISLVVFFISKYGLGRKF